VAHIDEAIPVDERSESKERSGQVWGAGVGLEASFLDLRMKDLRVTQELGNVLEPSFFRRKNVRLNEVGGSREDRAREVVAVEAELQIALQEFHPRAIEPGAGFLRDLGMKAFSESLTKENWGEIHEQVLVLGKAKAQALEKKFSTKLEKLNQQSLFSKDANKLRVESQLDVEIRRALNYEKLELEVLREWERKSKEDLSSSDVLNFFPRKQAQERDTEEGKEGEDIQEVPQDQERDLLDFKGFSSTAERKKKNHFPKHVIVRALGARGLRQVKLRSIRKSVPVGHHRCESLFKQEMEQPPKQANQSCTQERTEASRKEQSEERPQLKRQYSHKTTRKLDLVPDERSCKIEESILQVFQVLEMPAARRLEFMMHFSQEEENLRTFPDVLEELAETANLVVLSEKLLIKVELAKKKVIKGSNAFSDEEVEELGLINCFISMAESFGSPTHQWIARIQEKVHAKAQMAADRFKTSHGLQITFQGKPFA